MKTNNLGSWSWQSIQKVYRSYGMILNEYVEVKKRLNLPDQAHIDLPDDKNIIVLKFLNDVRCIDAQLKCLDAEIARRNNLIGVMG